MPPARRSASKPSARSAKPSGRSTQGVRARAAARSSATRREVEQSISRFEKRLDEANDALKTLGGHLGGGARGSYKEVTAALTALRRNASKTNKQALKDFDKLRAALTKTNSSSGSTRSTKASSTTKRAASRPAASRSTTKRATAKRTSASRAGSSRSTTKRSTSSRATASRSRAKKS